jgi:hypothetical protein
MSLEPFLRREWATSVRTSRAFRDRGDALLLASLVALGCFGVWDRLGWDRSTVAGASRFGVLSFGLTVGALAVLGLPIVIPRVSMAIASERDRKGLDPLLASQFTSLEIVLGAMSGGLFRYANALAASLPVLILLMVLGGVAPVWLFLAVLGMTSTALLMASFSVVVSVLAKSGSKALIASTGLFLFWVGMPATFVILRPLLWQGAPSWLIGSVCVLVDASPAGFLLNLAGLMPKPGGPVEAILRMAAYQSLVSLGLVGWAVARLRPIVREPRTATLGSKLFRLIPEALRKPKARPACGDNPVLWQEMHSTGGLSAKLRWLSQVVSLFLLLGLGTGLWWFAEPAFKELAARGFGASAEAFKMPKVDPIARLLVNKGQATSGPVSGPLPGQARLEFNIVLRQISALFLIGFIAVAFMTAVETLKGEQTRDSWLALISTPLSGGEILDGKLAGTLWKVRDGAFTLLGLWWIGVISGAIHPIGFVMASGVLIATAFFFIAQGQALALFSLHPERSGKPVISPVFLPVLIAATLVQIAAPMMLVWASLFSYEDWASILDSGLFPQFTETDLANTMRARSVLVTCLSGMTILALGAALLLHTNARSFDESIGRPTKPAFRPRSLTISALRARAVCDSVMEG